MYICVHVYVYMYTLGLSLTFLTHLDIEYNQVLLPLL